MTRCASLPALLGLTAALAAAPAPAAEDYFTAMLSDGTRLSGDQGDLHQWHDKGAKPDLKGRALFDDGNPLRWLVNNSLSVAETPPAYVEFVGGDRLPGDVLEYRTGAESPYERAAAHLVVRPSLELNWPDFGEETPVRVQARWLQRVAWESRPGTEYRPGTLFLRDGRQIPFRSLRWSAGSVTLLVDGGGIQEFFFGDIAEAHLPRQNPWASYVDQLATLSPSCAARLLQLDTTQGLRVTTSMERFQPRHRHDAGRHENWYQTVQPAWSLDPFWVRFRTIRAWRSFAPYQVPLTLVAPAAVRQESTFGSGWRWQVDRNVQQEPLRSGDAVFGWGFGVHALSELTFDLPASARSFRTRLGLDEIAGEGGCVRARVATSADPAKPLYESPVLVGSAQTADTGMLALPATGKPLTVTLTADPVISGRPQGADPFDIRDSLDWLEPEVHLDPEALKAEVRGRTFEQFAALEGWTPAESDRAAFELVNHWDESDPRAPQYRPLMKTSEKFVTLSRSFQVGPQDRWLGVAVDRPADPPARVQVRFKGRGMAEFAVPPRPQWVEPAMTLIPVEDFRGQMVDVELVGIPENASTLINWRAVSLLDRHPGLIALFEDDEQLVPNLLGGEGQAELVAEEPHAGKAALKVTPPGKSNASLPGMELPVREHPRLGEFRFIRFAWRKQGGKQIGLSFGHDGELGGELTRRGRRIVRAEASKKKQRPRRQVGADDRGFRHGFRYDAGQGDPPEPPVLRLDGRAPDKWVVVTRDLYGDFGNFTLTGLGLDCPDGEAAYFDHVWLARTQEDFNEIARFLPSQPTTPPTPTDPEVARRIDDRMGYGAITGVAVPQFVVDESHGGVWLLDEYRGKKSVVRTHAAAPGRPCILRTPLHVPAGKSARLELTVGHYPDRDWQLIVKADGQVLHDSVINKDTAKEGWADLKIDLSSLAGKKVLLEMHDHPNGWDREDAYWSRAAVVVE